MVTLLLDSSRLEVALSATLIVASRSATFSFPEVGLGLIAECGGLFRGPRALPLNVARELLLTGDPLPAQRAYELGESLRLRMDVGGELFELQAVVAWVRPEAIGVRFVNVTPPERERLSRVIQDFSQRR